jgi:hypothetical protein
LWAADPERIGAGAECAAQRLVIPPRRGVARGLRNYISKCSAALWPPRIT